MSYEWLLQFHHITWIAFARFKLTPADIAILIMEIVCPRLLTHKVKILICELLPNGSVIGP